MKRTAVAMLRSAVLTVLTTSLPLPTWASSGPSCERFAFNNLSPGMSYDLVRRTMGGEGIRSVTRSPDNRETSAADYPGPALDVYVEYDRRIDRRKKARTVRVRASMLLLPTIAEALVDRFGLPDAGAEDVLDGLNEGVAVWVDETCGLVLTAYHPRESWWKAEGRTTLQVETLDLARKGDSPASSKLNAILERKHGSPSASSMAAGLPRGTILFANSFLPNEPPTATTGSPAGAPDKAPLTAPASPVASIPVPQKPQAVSKAPPPAPRSIATPSPKAPAHPVKATPPITPAERITYVPPVYPRTARWLGMAGRVTLEIAVKADGRVTKNPHVLAEDPTGYGFAEAAVEAVRTWSFKPAIREGRPVKSTLNIDVEFVLQKN